METFSSRIFILRLQFTRKAHRRYSSSTTKIKWTNKPRSQLLSPLLQLLKSNKWLRSPSRWILSLTLRTYTVILRHLKINKESWIMRVDNDKVLQSEWNRKGFRDFTWFIMQFLTWMPLKRLTVVVTIIPRLKNIAGKVLELSLCYNLYPIYKDYLHSC